VRRPGMSQNLLNLCISIGYNDFQLMCNFVQSLDVGTNLRANLINLIPHTVYVVHIVCKPVNGSYWSEKSTTPIRTSESGMISHPSEVCNHKTFLEQCSCVRFMYVHLHTGQFHAVEKLQNCAISLSGNTRFFVSSQQFIGSYRTGSERHRSSMLMHMYIRRNADIM
jgi:hypothetical protein